MGKRVRDRFIEDFGLIVLINPRVAEVTSQIILIDTFLKLTSIWFYGN